MSERGYCTNCGAEIRPGNAFCVSCGAPVTPEPKEPGPTRSGPVGSAGSYSFNKPLTRLRRATGRLRATYSGPSTGGLRRLPREAAEWFRDLSGVPKLVLVGVLALILLALLSPVALVAAALLFGVSVLALVIRVVQRGPTRGWGMVAAASLVSMFVFGGVSSMLYGIGFTGDSAPGPGGGNEAVDESPAYGTSPGEGRSRQSMPERPQPARYASATVPPYTVVDSAPLEFDDPAYYGDVRGLSVVVGTSFTLADPAGVKSYADMAAIVKDVETSAPGYDVYYVKFLATIPDPDAPVPSAVSILTPVGADSWDDLGGPNISVSLDSAGYYCLDGQVCVEGVSIPRMNWAR